MRHGFTTLTQSQKCRANNGSILAHPLLWISRGFIQQGRWWSQSFGIVKGWSWLIILSNTRTHDKRCILCRRIETATSGNRNKEARKTDSWCSAIAGYRPCPLVTSCHGCCDLKSFLVPYSLLIWTLLTYLFPKLKSHHRGTQYGSNEGAIEAVREYLRDQERSFFVWKRKLEQLWAKCIA